jgi:hypothetical protein
MGGMRHSKLLMIFLCTAGFSAAYAVEPASSPAATQSAASQSSAAPSAAATAATASATPAPGDSKQEDASKDVLLAAQIKRVRSAGYKPRKMKDGTQVYCKTEAVIGSRFERESCDTADNLDKSIRDSKDLVESMQRQTMSQPRN